MAGRMLQIAPTEPPSSWTTARKLVVPLLAMNVASHSADFVKAEDSRPNSRTEPTGTRVESAATPTCTGVESNSEFEKDCVSGIKSLIEIANEHASKYPDQRPQSIFQFSAQRAFREVDDKSKTLTQTICYTGPKANSKFSAFVSGFGPNLDLVKIIVNGNQLEMLFVARRLFKSEVKAAESLIPYAVRATRNRWLSVVQRKLVEKCSMGTLNTLRKLSELALRRLSDERLKEIKLEGPEIAVAATAIKSALSKIRLFRSRLEADDGNSSDWQNDLTGEIVESWLEWIDPAEVVLKCSGSSTANDESEDADGVVGLVKNYVCHQLRNSTRPNKDKPVTIRLEEDNRGFFADPYTHNTCAMKSTGAEEGRLVSISDDDDDDDDAAGPRDRKVIICRTSNFTTALSDFLSVTDSGQSTSQEGHRGIELDEDELTYYERFQRKRNHEGFYLAGQSGLPP